ncbi:MAG TPA: ATP-binding cassette domain-containing protein [Clostridiales bacterium]|nr:ATP-binding cassette domain-containing protein [Clostridiales bacterium]
MLEIRDLTLEVEENVKILDDINLKLDKKKLYVITGPNGSGKSSLAKTIMGIYKPTSGKIYFEGQDITDLDITERAKLKIGYAFQQPPRFKGITVEELLKLSLKNNGSEDLDLCELLLDVGLCAQDYLKRQVDGSLSGGEIKRIELATVIARQLKLAIFDEPEAGIDLWSFQKLADTFETMHKKYDTTIVIISHQERILNLADEVIVMREGKIAEHTSKEKFLSKLENDADCICRQGCEKGALYDEVECYR